MINPNSKTGCTTGRRPEHHAAARHQRWLGAGGRTWRAGGRRVAECAPAARGWRTARPPRTRRPRAAARPPRAPRPGRPRRRPAAPLPPVGGARRALAVAARPCCCDCLWCAAATATGFYGAPCCCLWFFHRGCGWGGGEGSLGRVVQQGCQRGSRQGEQGRGEGCGGQGARGRGTVAGLWAARCNSTI